MTYNLIERLKSDLDSIDWTHLTLFIHSDAVELFVHSGIKSSIIYYREDKFYMQVSEMEMLVTDFLENQGSVGRKRYKI